MFYRTLTTTTLCCLSLFSLHARALTQEEINKENNAFNIVDAEVCRLLEPNHNTEEGRAIRGGVRQGVQETYGNQYYNPNSTELQKFARIRTVIEIGKRIYNNALATGLYTPKGADAIKTEAQHQLTREYENSWYTTGIYSNYVYFNNQNNKTKRAAAIVAAR